MAMTKIFIAVFESPLKVRNIAVYHLPFKIFSRSRVIKSEDLKNEF